MVIVVGNRCSVPNGPRRRKEFLTGSATGAIRLNTDLAKKPPECLEYIVVHELAHLIEPSHNARFVPVMDLFLPQWQLYRDELNRLPVRHEEWSYCSDSHDRTLAASRNSQAICAELLAA